MKKLFYLFVSGLVLWSCSDKDDDAFVPKPSENLEVQDFVWKALNLWYYWQGDVADLSDTRFSSNQEYRDFLSNYSDPEALFEHLKYNRSESDRDRFSWIVEDYNELVNSQQGIYKTNGVEFGLSKYSNSDDVFGYVRYILPNSDASTKNIRRGDVFVAVNGTTLTVDNYSELLFGQNDTYTLNMGDVENNTISPNGEEVTLTKHEYTEDPVYLYDVFTIGSHKIGYLVYNGFTASFDNTLNDVFSDFKSQGVTDLVLDLRYNPGGSVNSALQLSSMITGQFTGELFIKQRYNEKLQSQFSKSDLEDYFPDELSDGTAINSLGLNKVYVLALESSASASELVMNGLAPYIDVIHIGSETTGKNEFSITLVDAPEYNYIYNESRKNAINPNNSWGMQPLIGRSENADGFSDYTEGLIPDIELYEDLENMGILGSTNEPLLARAIQEITGVSARLAKTGPGMSIEILTDSKRFTPMKDNMYITPKDPEE
ncbi:carboxyl-terminal protease [Sinomicrobium pectinilyticum]|uniref:Carboxyl-terminal protease n=1 Tax=Sinomicrobium pectinilyticum TaxID=1084421 RepID=A0A3N0ESE5_SINP1|nr:S41 family peptidase [Sinomicrobium pectinilyticum]RNL90701.1 carboxyl-terminal protease [Sinomicrobium pectinilyticum]